MAAYIGLNSAMRALYEQLTTTVLISETSSIAVESGFIFATNTIELTLPTSVGNTSHRFMIKNVGDGIITIKGYNGETIDGYSTFQLTEKNSAIGVAANNGEWLVY